MQHRHRDRDDGAASWPPPCATLDGSRPFELEYAPERPGRDPAQRRRPLARPRGAGLGAAGRPRRGPAPHARHRAGLIRPPDRGRLRARRRRNPVGERLEGVRARQAPSPVPRPMDSTPAFAVADQHRLARAFLALGDDVGAPPLASPSLTRLVAAVRRGPGARAGRAADLDRARPAARQARRAARRHARQLEGAARRRPTTRTTTAPTEPPMTRPGRETAGGMSTVAEAPPWERERRARPTWGLAEGDAIAPGRTVLRRLGGGRRYEVFLVWDDHRLAVLVAKVLRPDQATEPAAMRDLTRECGRAGAARAPDRRCAASTRRSTARSRTCCWSTSRARRCSHCSSATAPCTSSSCCRSAMHVASALHYLAREDTVHLDVKPDNLVMGAPPRLIDFSVARSTRGRRAPGPAGRHRRLHGARAGRPRRGRRSGPPADVFGLGATLHHAVAGERPFPRPHGAGRSTDPEVRFPQLVQAARPAAAPHPVAAGRSCCAACSPRDPGDRPTAAEVAAALEPVVADAAAAARAGPPRLAPRALTELSSCGAPPGGRRPACRSPRRAP